MEFYNNIIYLVNKNLVVYLIPLLLSVGLLKLILGEKLKTDTILRIISWIIILYAFFGIINLILEICSYPVQDQFIQRATGEFWKSYLFMLFSATILPLSLLYRKLRTNFWYILLISFFIKIGLYLEYFTIVTIKSLRHYKETGEISIPFSEVFKDIFPSFVRGFILAISLALVIHLLNKRATTERYHNK